MSAEPEVVQPRDDDIDAALAEAEPQVVHAEVVDVPEPVDTEPVDTDPTRDEPMPLSEVLEAAGVFERRPEPGPVESDPVPPDAAQPDSVRPEAIRTARRSAPATPAKPSRADRRDRIVEPPREPKVPLGQRLRSLGRSKDGGDAVTAGRRSSPRTRVVSVLAGLIGAAGLLCSVVLAFGALLVALDATGSGIYDSVSRICDVLVGPLRDAFSFSGTNAEMKESLVAWGAGAIAYLVVGVVAQSLLRATVED